MNKVASSHIGEAAADWIVRRDAGLTEAEQKELALWQKADPRHAAALAQHDLTWAALDRPREVGRGKFAMARFAASASQRRRRRFTTAGAVFSLVLCSGLIWHARRPVNPGFPARDAVVSTAVVARADIRSLPDGSRVELNTDTEIATDFSAELRRVVLHKGEAHFQVAKDNLRPFVVLAGGVEVRATGTAFSVEIGTGEIKVLVTEGQIVVDNPAATLRTATTSADGKPMATADAGSQVIVEIAAAKPLSAVVTAVSESHLEERLAWRAPRLEFSNTPLPHAVALMNEHSTGRKALKFVIDDPALASVQVSGFFRADNAETFVRLLEVSFGVAAERRGVTIHLSTAR